MIKILKIGILFWIILTLIPIITAEICECNSCEDCNKKLSNFSCDKVVLSDDIYASGGEYINILNVENKTFDCQGHKIVGKEPGRGIVLRNSTKCSLINCKISSLDGITLYSSHYNTIKNTIINGSGGGISALSDSNFNLIYNNTVINSYSGVLILSSSKNKVINNNISFNDNGVEIVSASFNEIINNEIYQNIGSGISISPGGCISLGCIPSINNTVSHNKIIMNTIGINALTETYALTGENVSTNFTADSNEICLNIDKDIEISEGSSMEGKNNTCNNERCQRHCNITITNCNCASCMECRLKLRSSKCKEVKLISDILFSYYGRASCISFPLENKTFDCNTHTIKNGPYSYYATAMVVGIENITIKNCIVKDFFNGIIISGSNCKIINTMVNGSKMMGILLYGAKNTSIINSILTFNQQGIEITGDGTKLLNNSIMFNDEGIYAGGADLVMDSNIICNNKLDVRGNKKYLQNPKGINNFCDISEEWHDDKKEGCMYNCTQIPVKQEIDYNKYLIMAIILITILSSLLVIWYKKFK